MSRTPGTAEATSTKASISSVLEAPDRVTRPALELTCTRATSARSARRRSAAARWLVRLVVDADLLGDALRVVAAQAPHHACLPQLEAHAHAYDVRDLAQQVRRAPAADDGAALIGI